MLDFLGKQLASAKNTEEKVSILETIPLVKDYFRAHPFLHALNPQDRCIVQQMAAIGQAERLIDPQHLPELLEKLSPIDHFYREIGGIVGYQAKILELLQGKKEEGGASGYHSPAFIDITEENNVQEAISWGLEAMPELAEIYPLGGAADRLHLVEEKTGIELPAAKLPFAGRTLLEGLIRDLEAREYLYFQKYGVKIITPIAIMTSHEKNNHAHVLEICKEHNFFDRPADSFRFFTQPLVPAVNERGDWCLTGPSKPLLKPGGHGAIWKLARDGGIFQWLESLRRTKALIRQINNPIAGLDYGLLAFTGIGCKKKMIFGFASCPRLLQAAEGVNVLIEKEKQIVLTNIEYCDFAKFGIEDQPLKEGEPYSRFSSNTNILFADLKAIARAVDESPFPGLLINLKKASYTTESGEKKEESIARLESTMQNIADVFLEEKKATLQTERTFVTYNHRNKTISTAKKAYLPGKPLQETPENCFYDLLTAHRELLLSCGFSLPPQRTLQEYLEQGPSFLFLYHPALGPLYSLIREKLSQSTLSLGSELLLEIAHGSISDLHLQGSLQIIAEQPLESSCILKNVTVENEGIDWSRSAPFWKMDLQRKETIQIILKGKSTFIAQNAHLKGSHFFIVEDGQTLRI